MAESTAVRLELENHEVFYDRQDLESGRGYDQKIRQEIENCDLFVFFISPDSITKGRYTLTEVKFARQKWRNLNGRVLPVMVRPTAFDKLPAVLAALDILTPEGNLAAEVVARVAQLAATPGDRGNVQRHRRSTIVGASLSGIALATLGVYIMLKQEEPLNDDPVEPPPVVIAECDDQSELAGCDLDLAMKICAAQRATSRLLDSGSPEGASEIGGQRRSIYLYGKVNSQDSMDIVQLDTLMNNVRDFLVEESLETVPPASSGIVFLDGPVALKTEYDAGDALLILSAKLNPPYVDEGVQTRGGSSSFYFGKNLPISVDFTLPENNFVAPYELHRAAIAYSRAELAATAEQKMELLSVAREAVNRACKGR